jgi:type III secretion protein I
MDLVSPLASTLLPAIHGNTLAATPLGADPSATTRFAGIMNAQPTPLAEAIDQAYPAVPLENRTLGDSVLAGMQNLSSHFQHSWKTVNATRDTGSAMTMSDMLKLQMGLAQMAIRYDLMGKAISRSTHDLDQRVKLQ